MLATCAAHALLVVTYDLCCGLLDVSTVASNSDPVSIASSASIAGGSERDDDDPDETRDPERVPGFEPTPCLAAFRNRGFLPSPF
jgi:hypothetical protein